MAYKYQMDGWVDRKTDRSGQREHYLIDIDAISLHVGLVIHLPTFHELHEKNTLC